ncbi:hypothetical protein CVT24_004703 [Panaeolus cyanescens]|uniref:F-box domain-containing protein n=1 Tax=Panaeolus cyanescens TaxID=181874 RepID=A0A409YSR4_9AGAR|nr:hypothetical protein CVT24_004703 [Panaeolus cyanescens]
MSPSQRHQTLPIELLTYIIELGWKQPLWAKERAQYIQTLSIVSRSFYTILRAISLQDAWIISPAQASIFISEITGDPASKSNSTLPSTSLPPKYLCKSITFHFERKEQHTPPSAKFTKLYFDIIHFVVYHSLLPNLKVVVLFHLGHTLFDAISHILVTDLRIPREATFIVDNFFVFTKEQEQATASLLKKQNFKFTPSQWQNLTTRQSGSRFYKGLQHTLASKSKQRLRDELVFYLTSIKFIRLAKRSTDDIDAQAKFSGPYAECKITSETSDVPSDLQPVTPYEDLLYIFDVFGDRSEDLQVEGVYCELRKEESIHWDEYEDADADELDDIDFKF